MEANSMYRDRGQEEMRPVGEVEFANGVAAMCSSGVFGKTRVAAGIVGHADMMLGSRVEPVLNALMRAGGDRFRGIRHGVSWEAEAATIRPNPSTRAGMLADKKFREGVAVLGRLGLSYDVSLYHTQIPEVADLAGALPKTRIVLNHVGGVLGLGSYRGKQTEVFSRWASSIKALASRANVYVKLGGLGQSYTAMRFDGDAEPPSSEQLAAASALTSKPASRRSERRAACLRATFQSTRSRTSGMPASCWRRAPARRESRSVRGYGSEMLLAGWNRLIGRPES